MIKYRTFTKMHDCHPKKPGCKQNFI